jgi:hypothetical protein
MTHPQDNQIQKDLDRHQSPAVQAESFRNAQAEEYGQWVAVDAIYEGTALAYNAGDPVPVSNVKRNGYDRLGLVAKVGTAKAKAVGA